MLGVLEVEMSDERRKGEAVEVWRRRAKERRRQREEKGGLMERRKEEVKGRSG